MKLKRFPSTVYKKKLKMAGEETFKALWSCTGCGTFSISIFYNTQKSVKKTLLKGQSLPILILTKKYILQMENKNKSDRRHFLRHKASQTSLYKETKMSI